MKRKILVRNVSIIINPILKEVKNYELKHLDRITFVKPSGLPTRLISMGQSYTVMLEQLQSHHEFSTDKQLSPEKFIEIQKKRYSFDEKLDRKTKYIHQRRKKIADRFNNSINNLLGPVYADTVK